MLYRTMGRTGVDVSILGFGCMRLPIIGGDQTKIDYELATEMLHYAIESGVNYVDTAWFYHGTGFTGPGGESEPFVGEALSGGWRDRVNLATKLPQQLCREPEDLERFLTQQLERLKTDHIDFYLVHGITGEAWDRLVGLGIIEFLDAARADGRIWRITSYCFVPRLKLVTARPPSSVSRVVPMSETDAPSPAARSRSMDRSSCGLFSRRSVSRFMRYPSLAASPITCPTA